MTVRFFPWQPTRTVDHGVYGTERPECKREFVGNAAPVKYVVVAVVRDALK